MRTIFFFLFGLLLNDLQAQRPIQISERGELIFANGFHPIVTDDLIYFNAFHQKKGWQLFTFDGENLEQISRFKTKFKVKKVVETAAGGGMVSNMVVFNQSLIFHAFGKTTKPALYQLDGEDISKLVNRVIACSDPVVFNDQLYIEAIFSDEESDYKRTIIFSEGGEISKSSRLPVGSLQAVQCVNVLNDKIFGVKAGQLVKWTERGFVNAVMPYTHVQNTFVMSNQLYFTGLKKGNSKLGLFALDQNGKVTSRGDIFPGMNMLIEQKPVVVDSNAYFVADPTSKALELYKISTDSFVKSATLTTNDGYRSVQGMLWDNGLLYLNLCGLHGTDYDLMEYDGVRVDERNPDRLRDVRNTIAFNQQLVYLSSEMGGDALYASRPVLPPRVEDDTFRIFDFWGSGAWVGRVHATDLKGRLRYQISSGDEENAFQIDKYDGQIEILDPLKIKERQGKPFHLEISVTNRRGVTGRAAIRIDVVKGKPMDRRNLHETLMFFPDFSHKGTLTTRTLSEGQVVWVYDVDFNMMDELVVRNKAITLGSYAPGIYLLNARNNRNLYQKIELH
jgi:Cadherin domain